MANKKETKSSKTPREVDTETKRKVGTLGQAVGYAYLKEKTSEKALAAVEKILRAAAREKGKTTGDEYIHSRAISWIGFLKTKFPAVYKDLPSDKKVVKTQAKTTGTSKKQLVTA